MLVPAVGHVHAMRGGGCWSVRERLQHPRRPTRVLRRLLDLDALADGTFHMLAPEPAPRKTARDGGALQLRLSTPVELILRACKLRSGDSLPHSIVAAPPSIEDAEARAGASDECP